MLGKPLEFLRLSHDLTQTELGKEVGVSQSKICRLERKPNEKVDLELLKRLATYFNVPIHYFIPEDPKATQFTITLNMPVPPRAAHPDEKGGKLPRKRREASAPLNPPPSL